jgi:5-formyltetrahydrofolate cyclo-ligase
MASTVAAFVSQDGEPGTGPLIEALHARDVSVMLPILREDFDLEWGTYEPGAQQPGRFGLLVPTTRPLGVDAIARADVVVCPGVAVDPSGNRLGRGGGSYDRALARCADSVLRVQLVYDDEVLAEVPTDPHDQPVHVVVTPTATIRVSRPASG